MSCNGRPIYACVPKRRVAVQLLNLAKESPSHVLGKVGVFVLREDEEVVHFGVRSVCCPRWVLQNTVEQVLEDSGDVNRSLH